VHGRDPKRRRPVHLLVIILEAIAELDEEAFALAEAYPFKVTIHCVLVERLLDLCRKAGHVAPQSDGHAGIASNVLRGRDPDCLSLTRRKPATGSLVDNLEKLLACGQKCAGAQSVYDMAERMHPVGQGNTIHGGFLFGEAGCFNLIGHLLPCGSGDPYRLSQI
jgi:hypothetical protein